MTSSLLDLIGAWRQIEPDPDPATITIHFHPDGRFLYCVGLQEIALRWRVEGELLITTRPNAAGEQVNPFRLESSPQRLILGGHVYVR